MCEKKILFIFQPIQTFETTTLGRDLFDFALTVVSFNDSCNEIAFFIAVLGKTFFASVILSFLP